MEKKYIKLMGNYCADDSYMIESLVEDVIDEAQKELLERYNQDFNNEYLNMETRCALVRNDVKKRLDTLK